MAQIFQAKEVTLEDLEDRFGLQASPQSEFFDEWKTDLPELSETERHQLSRIQENYQSLSRRGNCSEETVKMVVLSPLLDLADFYQAPFSFTTEVSTEITSEDEGTTVKGKIDALVVRQRLWILVIESKSTQFDVLSTMPQALVYMLSGPDLDKAIYGFLVNGREFVFIKLIRRPAAMYARSFALSIDRGDDLVWVLKVLKALKQMVLS